MGRWGLSQGRVSQACVNAEGKQPVERGGDPSVLVCPGLSWFEHPKSYTLGIPCPGKIGKLGELVSPLEKGCSMEEVGRVGGGGGLAKTGCRCREGCGPASSVPVKRHVF